VIIAKVKCRERENEKVKKQIIMVNVTKIKFETKAVKVFGWTNCCLSRII
jgi:hypothetical protein